MGMNCVENYIFWSEVGSGFGELGGTPPLRIPKSTPPPPQGYGLRSCPFRVS